MLCWFPSLRRLASGLLKAHGARPTRGTRDALQWNTTPPSNRPRKQLLGRCLSPSYVAFTGESPEKPGNPFTNLHERCVVLVAYTIGGYPDSTLTAWNLWCVRLVPDLRTVTTPKVRLIGGHRHTSLQWKVCRIGGIVPQRLLPRERNPYTCTPPPSSNNGASIWWNSPIPVHAPNGASIWWTGTLWCVSLVGLQAKR